MTNSKLGLYSRVSTELQVGLLEDRKKTLLDFAEQNGMNVSKVYTEFSSSISKQATEEIITDARNGEVNSLLVNQWSEFSRNQKEARKIIAQLTQSGISVHTIDGISIDTDNFFSTFNIALDELETSLVKKFVIDRSMYYSRSPRFNWKHVEVAEIEKMDDVRLRSLADYYMITSVLTDPELRHDSLSEYFGRFTEGELWSHPIFHGKSVSELLEADKDEYRFQKMFE